MVKALASHSRSQGWSPAESLYCNPTVWEADSVWWCIHIRDQPKRDSAEALAEAFTEALAEAGSANFRKIRLQEKLLFIKERFC